MDDKKVLIDLINNCNDAELIKLLISLVLAG